MIEDFINLWYQSGKGKSKTKSKGSRQTKKQSTSNVKSKSKSNTHSKKKYIMDEPNPELMKYPSYKREYECKSQRCKKDWVKFNKCGKNVCNTDKIKKTMLGIEKNSAPLNQCIEDNCYRELKNLSQPRGKFNFKKFEKFQNCSTKKCDKETKKFEIDLKKITSKKNPQHKNLVKVGMCLLDKCDKYNVKYQNCKKSNCSKDNSNKSKASKSKKQPSSKSKSKSKTKINHSNQKMSKKHNSLSSSNKTKKSHVKPNFLNISRVKI